MRSRAMYVGRRPRRRGMWLIYTVIYGLIGLLAVGLGFGLFVLWNSPIVANVAVIVGPTPTATLAPTPTATPVPMVVGQVTDAYTGAPLSGVAVSLGDQQHATSADGSFRIPRPVAVNPIRLSLVGYETVEQLVGPGQGDTPQVALRPNRLAGVVRGNDGQPLSGARVAAGGQTVTTDGEGRFTLADLPPNATLTVEATDHARVSEPIGRRVTVELNLRTSTISGIVTGKDGAPIARATVGLGENSVLTDRDGRFRFSTVVEPGTLAIKAGGFRAVRKSVQPGDRVEVALEPLIVKAIYLTHRTAGDDRRFAELLALVKRTELNAMVIDVKGEFGDIFFDSKVPLAREIGAVEPAFDVKKRLQQLREANVYVIARQVIMEDSLLAKARPDWAVRHKATGQVWKDVNGIGWLNPYRTEIWDYNIAIAREVAALGFDEVQFDYVRFPSDGQLTQIDYGRPSTEETRMAAIAAGLARARDALAPTGVFFSADVFGLTTVADDDVGIGQSIEALADAVDYLCPMVYPSHYARGTFGFPNPAAKPYEVVTISLTTARPRLGEGRARLRPWLQDFDLFGTAYTPDMVRVQIKASEENGTSGWLIWNAGNKYQEAALRPRNP